MERVNSWGREIKEKFSVSFKKDEEDIKLFLNEQPSPVEYLKVLVRKDMAGIKMSTNKVIQQNEPVNEKLNNRIDESEPNIGNEEKQKMLDMLNGIK